MIETLAQHLAATLLYTTRPAVRTLLGRRRLLISLLAITLSCCSFRPVAADEILIHKKEIKQDIEHYRGQIRRLQRGIQEQKSKSEESSKTERNILEELEELDSRLRIQRQKVAELAVKVQLQQVLINLKQEEITGLQSDREAILAHLRKRSGAYYKMGEIGFLNVTFSSQSLPDLLRFHDAFQTLITYDKDVIVSYRKKIQALERARDAHALEMEVLQDFITTAQLEREETDRIRAEKEQLLTHIRTQKHLHEQAASEMEKASEDLSNALVALKSKEQDLEQTFARSKGQLPAPLPGEVITYFNQEKTNKLGILRKSTGIAIQAPNGSKVRAVADGTVIFSGYLRGYGNTVVIHHGFQYFTVTSRLEQIIPKEGDSIKVGGPIGQLSDTATLIDEGLYFEIRHGKQSQDPLEWLDTSKLQLTEPPAATQPAISLPAPPTPEFTQ